MRLASIAHLAAAAGAALLTPVSACPGVEHAAPARRSDRMATQPSGGTGLLRPLRWGDVQILATTDIHGWYQGHLKASQPEPNFSGDWGDFASFAQHMRAQAARRGVDLLLVDSGDLHDGAGLSDGYPAGQGPDGHVSNQFHSLVRFDALAVGNHELYVYANALDTFRHFRPAQHGRYLASNVNITHTPHGSSSNVSEPMGERFVKFRTPLGRRVTSLGVLFNFTGAAAGLTVQDPARMVEEQWFNEAIQERPDFFLLVGHMPVRKDQWPTVLAPIRKLHPDTPVFIAGGHTHIRDTVVYDKAAVGIESGRYLETIGWLSANLTRGAGDDAAVTGTSFSRSYIDANRRNYAFHAGLSEKRLDTPLGRHITTAMGRVARDWNLTQVYGTAPQDYYLDRTSPDSPNSLLRLLSQQVLPTVISSSNAARKGVPNLVLANSGSQRFDVYSGPFTRNDQYIVSPFLDSFLYLRDVPYKYASQLIGKLNGDATAHANSRRDDEESSSAAKTARAAAYARGEVDFIYNDWRREQHERAQADLAALDRRADEQRTLGYSTKDDMGTDGDDTEHVALPYAHQPDYVASPLTGNSTAAQPDTLVDVIFVDFILSSVVRLLNGMQSSHVYSKADAANYTSLTTQDLYPHYAAAAWQQK